ncbi:MAG: hypothetical protein ACFFCE_19440 [Promethearchaeota archaeon]
MKGLCYIILIIGFFIFFQQNPVYAIICIVLFIGVYLLFRSRSLSSSRGVLGFLTGNHSQQDSRINDLITLMMVQQLLNSHNDQDLNIPKYNNQDKKDYIEKIKNEVLELLDEE